MVWGFEGVIVVVVAVVGVLILPRRSPSAGRLLPLHTWLRTISREVGRIAASPDWGPRTTSPGDPPSQG